MKIGIVTQYYKSINYGGNLQAYALCKYLNDNGFDAEQISFGHAIKRKSTIRVSKVTLKKIVKKCFEMTRPLVERFFHKKACNEYIRILTERKNRFFHFNQELIPHSNRIYSDEDIYDCADIYESFITGSDQVWNFNMFRKAYFLDFVPSNKTKISYAASIAMPTLSEQQKSYFKEALFDYTAVSVREQSAIDLISDLASVQVEVVADPVLLLSYSDWDRICSKRIIDGPYIFSYFLGDNYSSRKLCKEYAEKNHLKIVNIPMANNKFRFIDKSFGDIEYNASPEEFLSLIKYADVIFTDSFHAVVISNIFEKQYFVFKRSANDEMSSRIKDITHLFGTEDRYCCTEKREKLMYIQNVPAMKYGDSKTTEELINRSKNFLQRNLLNNEE